MCGMLGIKVPVYSSQADAHVMPMEGEGGRGGLGGRGSCVCGEEGAACCNRLRLECSIQQKRKHQQLMLHTRDMISVKVFVFDTA